ncbi:MAG: major capsid protein [Microviridae sp.]|nr:MAG: major capsid protein [Microviridae sp.]
MQKVTIGGERLGSGAKMKAELHAYERSTHDLSYIWRSTMSPGTLVPVMSQIALTGDTWDIDLNAMVNTHPALGPLFGSMKLQLDAFRIPMRLYNRATHNNKLNIGRNMAAVKFPLIEMINTNIDDATDRDNSQINPSSLYAYLGIRGVGAGAGGDARYFNAQSLLGYWDIVKNYYANKQEEIGAYIHTTIIDNVETVDTITSNGTPWTVYPTNSLAQLVSITPIEVAYTGAVPQPDQIMVQLQYAGWQPLSSLITLWGSLGGGVVGGPYNNRFGVDYVINWRYKAPTDINTVKPQVVTFPLINIDNMRDDILEAPFNAPFLITGASDAPYGPPLVLHNDEYPTALSSQEGLAVKTYQSDLFNNWVSTDWIDGAGGVNEVTRVSTVGDYFEIDSLIIAKKVYNMLNRIAVSGGTFKDWNDVVYMETDAWQAEIPVYLGGLSKEIIFQEVVSNSVGEAQGVNQPLGTLAGRGTLGSKHKGGHITVRIEEPSYLMVIASITPRVDYSQGNSWDIHLKSWDDLHKPALDQIGFEDSQNEQRAWWSTRFAGGIWATTAVGKLPAWINYMTNVNKTFGNFAIQDNEMFMTLNRRYESDGGNDIRDLTTYIDPAKFNFIFADPSIDAQNFWVQIGLDIECRRLLAAKIMPNL